jgi:hypothetical protein
LFVDQILLLTNLQRVSKLPKSLSVSVASFLFLSFGRTAEFAEEGTVPMEFPSRAVQQEVCVGVLLQLSQNLGKR